MLKPFPILATTLLALTASLSANASTDSINCGSWTLTYRQASNTPDSGIIITKATGNGELDLTSVEGHTIVGALPSAFAYNRGLTAIKFPASFTKLNEELFIKESITGTGTPYTGTGTTASTEGIGTIPLGYRLNEQAVRIDMEVETDGSCFNEHGSCLLASGSEPFADGAYGGGFQIFLEQGTDGEQTITVKNGESDYGTKFTHATGSKFKVEIYYNPHYTFLMVEVEYEDGTVDTVSSKTSEFSVDTLCYGLPKGVNETFSISDACMPFAGCSALKSITIAEGSTAYTNGADGVLLNSDGTSIAAYPYGKLFDKTVRIRSVSNPSACLSVNTYASGSEYADRSADFQSPEEYYGPTLFTLVANENGTCSFRHLNSGFLLGEKSDSSTSTLDAVENSSFSGSYDYTLLPDSPLDAQFIFTDPYTGPVPLFDGVWCISNTDNTATLTKNVNIASEDNLFCIEEITSVEVPLNSEGYATVALPIGFSAPSSGSEAYTVTGYDASTKALQLTWISGDTSIEPGNGIILKGTPNATVSLKLSNESQAAYASANMLTGTGLRIVGAEGTTYILDGASFTAQTGGDIPFNSAYLESTALPETAEGENTLGMTTGIITGVDGIQIEPSQYENLYDLSGRPVTDSNTKGLLISPLGKYLRR